MQASLRAVLVGFFFAAVSWASESGLSLSLSSPMSAAYLSEEVAVDDRAYETSLEAAAVLYPSRRHRQSDAVYRLRHVQAHASLGSWSNPQASLPWTLGIRAYADHRQYSSRHVATQAPRLLISAQDRAVELYDGDDPDILSEIAEYEVGEPFAWNSAGLPLTRALRYGLQAQGGLDVGQGWKLHGRFDMAWSRSRGGHRRRDHALEAGLSYHFHENESLLFGATWRSLSPYKEREGKVLPLIEWRARYSEDFLLFLGFPRLGFFWNPDPYSQLSFSWEYPYDVRVLYRRMLWSDVGLETQLFHSGTAYSAGVNQLFYDLIDERYFFFPNPEDYAVGRENNLYLRSAAAQLGLWWQIPEQGLRLRGGASWAFSEHWSEGASAREATVRARLAAGLGGYLMLSWQL